MLVDMSKKPEDSSSRNLSSVPKMHCLIGTWHGVEEGTVRYLEKKALKGLQSTWRDTVREKAMQSNIYNGSREQDKYFKHLTSDEQFRLGLSTHTL